MKRTLARSLAHPIGSGLVLGLLLPFVVVAPAVLFGHFERLQSGGNVYFLLPVLALLAFPAGFAAVLFQRLGGDRKGLWRFCTGLLIGGSLAGALLLAVSTADLAAERRLVFSVFGGVLLAGFWLWLGAFIAGFLALEKRDPGTPQDTAPFEESS